MKKNVNFAIAIFAIALVGVSSCKEDKQAPASSSPYDSFSRREADDLHLRVEMTPSDPKKLKLVSSKPANTPVVPKAPLPKTQAKPRRSSVSGISPDTSMMNEILRNRQTHRKGNYRISCDSVCSDLGTLSLEELLLMSDEDFEKLLRQGEVENSLEYIPDGSDNSVKDLPQEVNVFVFIPENSFEKRKPFSFHNIVTDEYDSIKIDRLYLGNKATSELSFDDGILKSDISTRLAASLSCNPGELRWLSLKLAFFMEVSKEKKVEGNARLFFDLKPSKRTTISIGYTPSIAGLSKPDFVSEQGQEEKNTEAILPGVQLGVKSNFHFDFEKSGSLDLKAGVFLDNIGGEFMRTNPSHYSIQIGVSGGGDGYVMEESLWLYHLGQGEDLGVGFSLKQIYPWFSVHSVLRSGYYDGRGHPTEDFLFGNLTTVPLFWTGIRALEDVEFISDIVYNVDKDSWANIENGLSYNLFPYSKYVGCSILATYDLARNSLNGKLLIHTK